MENNLNKTLDRICAQESLSQKESHDLFSKIVCGELSPVEISALLVSLKAKGETPEEIAGAAQALRTAAAAFNTQGLTVADSCGTGGDGMHTVNISTATALVAAEAGLPIAKHGNRSISSACGSADVLEQCGIKIDADPAVSTQSLAELGICFLFAPSYHSGMKHAMPIRRELRVRTIFNLIGPLSNPAQPAWQVVGVYDPALCVPLARTLGLLGCQAALVVHGSGLDEIAIHGNTTAAYWHDNQLEQLTINPKSLGLKEEPIEALKGGQPEENASWLKNLLSGQASPAHFAAVAVNAGALLWISGQTDSHKRGVEKALDILYEGKTIKRLERWAEITHGT
jgi:anthranilate phosphoribosyltransferase